MSKRGERITEKKCSSCHTIKGIGEFRITTRGRGRPEKERMSSSFSPYCIECDRKVMAKRIAEYRKTNPRDSYNSFRNWSLRKKYGIEPEEYDRLFVKQHGRCAICDRHQSELNRRLAVDHDHSTGVVRALLCDGCNRGLGMFHDDPILLQSALSFLLNHKKVVIYESGNAPFLC